MGPDTTSSRRIVDVEERPMFIGFWDEKYGLDKIIVWPYSRYNISVIHYMRTWLHGSSQKGVESGCGGDGEEDDSDAGAE